MISLFGPIKVDILDADLPYVKLKPQRKLSRSSQAVMTRLGDKTYKLRVRAVRRDDDGATWAELLADEALQSKIDEHVNRRNSDRRRARRDRVSMTVRSPDLPNFRGQTYDLSRSGLRVVTDGPVEVGLRVRLELDDRTLERERPARSVCAVTVWSTRLPNADYHLGLRFLSVN